MDDSQDQIRNEGPGGSGSTAELDPDMATVISNIMNHAERVEEQYFLGQQQLAESNDQSGQRGMVFVKANSHLKIQSLPILDNLVGFIFSSSDMPILTRLFRPVYSDSIIASQVELPGYHRLRC